MSLSFHIYKVTYAWRGLLANGYTLYCACVCVNKCNNYRLPFKVIHLGVRSGGIWNNIEWDGVYDPTIWKFWLIFFRFCNVGRNDIDDANLGVFWV